MSTFDHCGVFTAAESDDAAPAEHLAAPPYRAELFNAASGWSGVMNANGVNVLTFRRKPGCTITDYETAQRIAERWNAQEN